MEEEEIIGNEDFNLFFREITALEGILKILDCLPHQSRKRVIYSIAQRLDCVETVGCLGQVKCELPEKSEWLAQLKKEISERNWDGTLTAEALKRIKEKMNAKKV